MIQKIMFVACMFLLFYSTYHVFTGSHNVDLAFNMLRSNLKVDTASDGKNYTSAELYKMGMSQLTNGMILVVLFVCCLSGLYFSE